MTARMTRSGRTKLCVLAAAAMVALTGCGATHPGVAAAVGSATISHDRVDGLAWGLCSAQIMSAESEGNDGSNLPMRSNRRVAMEILLETELSLIFGEQEGVAPSEQMVSQAVVASEDFIETLPEGRREAFRDASTQFEEARLILVEIGRSSLEADGQSDVSDDQATAEGQRLRTEFVESIDVDVDPRYGTFEENALRPGGTELSVAASDSARAGEGAAPPPGFVSGLPASQRCS